jgi:hypothetical protein
MPDPISFTSATPRLLLPLLFAGQAQKEFTVNEAHARIDALLHAAIEGEANDPPGSPADGECWLAGSAPTGAWDGHAGELACYEAATWLFIAPRDGMRLLDRSTGQVTLYRGGWSAPSAPAAPAGGSTVDAEARAAIAALLDVLGGAGILPG